MVKCEDVLNDPMYSDPTAPPRGPVAFVRGHWVALLVVAVVLALMIGLMLYLRHKQPEAVPAGRDSRGARGGQNGPVAVSVATASSGVIQLRIPALGTVTPLATVT